MHASPPNSFTPRKEFKQTSHALSSFGLLTFSSSSLIRLYSFPPPVVSALRRYLDERRFTAAYKEDTSNNYCEFTLQGKPWNSPKSIATERLMVNVFAVLLQCGFSLLSTLDYGREQDDRVALAFSKPFVANGSNPGSTHSPSTLTTQATSKQSTSTLPLSYTVPFAVSFTSATTLRVISPPLHSTPAILGSVRGSWPRGVVSEKKIGDSCYEFKLKGYRWFQEDTFATDSLRHILTLLESLDSHSFTLMTSISLANHSRVKDLWIFTATSDEQHQDLRASNTEDLMLPDSPPATPLMSSTEPSRSRSPLFATTFGEGLPHDHKRYATAPTLLANDANHTRSATEGQMPRSTSPLRHDGAVLRKPAPRAQVPISIADTLPPAPARNYEGDRAVLPSTVESSINMTGVGANAASVLDKRDPDVQFPLYPVEPPEEEVIYSSDEPSSSSHQHNMAIVSPTPVLAGRSESPFNHSSPEFPLRTQPDISISPPISQYLEAPTHSDSPAASPKHWTPPTDQPRTPSPPLEESAMLNRDDRMSGDTPTSSTLLGPNAFRNDSGDRETVIPEGFRDSAFTTGSDWKSFDIPIKWTGPGPEPKRMNSSPGPSLPGAWASSPLAETREEDEATNVFEAGFNTKEKTPEQQDTEAQAKVPEMVQGIGRKSETGLIGVITPSPAQEKPEHKEKQPSKLKRASEGWVVVNVEGQSPPAPVSESQRQQQASGTHGAGSSAIQSTSAPGTSKGLDGSNEFLSKASSPNGTVRSAAAAAKSIAIIDAKGKRSSTTSSTQPPAFRRLLSFSRKEPKDKVSEGNSVKEKEKGGFRHRFRLGSRTD